MPRLVTAIILIVLPAACCAAQEAPYPDYDQKGKSVTVQGQGVNSCNSFVTSGRLSVANGMHYQDVAWLLGFLNGIDTFNPYTTKQYNYETLNTWVMGYCKAHPSILLANAGLEFYKFIGGRAPMRTDYTIWQHYPK